MDKSKFLNLMSMIESSGGKNLNRKPITQGIQAGTTAEGQYGLMPNTKAEFDRRALKSGKEAPKNDDEYANAVADHISAKTDDPRKQAYMWQYGHNLDPNKLDDEMLANNPRVNRFDQLSKKLGIEQPKAKSVAKQEVPEIIPESIEPASQENILAVPPEPPIIPELSPEAKPPMLQAALSPAKQLPPVKTKNPYDYKFKDFDTITARTDASRIPNPEELKKRARLV